MAIRGRKPTPPALRLIQGGKRRPTPPPDPLPSGSIERPQKLRGAAGKLWDTFISRCWWLTWADGPKAAMWCHLQAQFERAPDEMVASRIAQLRALGAELGFDQAARTRMGISSEKKQPPDPWLDDPADEYFT